MAIERATATTRRASTTARGRAPGSTDTLDASSPVEAARLTRRQADVLQLLVRGQTNREISNQYGISERTVRAHISSLFRKFAVTSRAALIATVLTSKGRGTKIRRATSSRTKARAMRTRFAPYERAPFMVAVTLGPEHRYVFCNDLAARVAGRARERIVGRTVRELYPEIDDRFAKALDDVYRTGIAWSAGNAPGRYTHEDGTFRDVVLNLMFEPLRDANGVTEGILHIGTEVARP